MAGRPPSCDLSVYLARAVVRDAHGAMGLVPDAIVRRSVARWPGWRENAGGAPGGGAAREGSRMKSNMGSVDRIVRIVLGLAIVSLVFVGPKSPWGWLGLIPIATGVVGFCGLYAPFRFTTRKTG